jgi:hypothetical protein
MESLVARSLVGTWTLVDWTASVDETVLRPFGGKAEGWLTYTEDGRMWAALQRRDRAALGTGTLAAATAEQRAAAAAGYLSYGGRYTRDGDRVVHHVETSLFPDWIGAVQIRLISWVRDDLVLSTPDERSAGGRTVVNRLRWSR